MQARRLRFPEYRHCRAAASGLCAILAARSGDEIAAKRHAVESVRDARVTIRRLPPLPAGPCPDGLYRADSGEIVRIHHGRPEPAF